MRFRRPGRGRPPRRLERVARGLRRRSAEHRTNRSERIVGHLAGPHEIPQRDQQLGVGRTPRRGAQLAPEAGALRRRESARTRIVQRTLGRVAMLPRRGQLRELVGEAQPDPTVAGAEPAGTHPHELAGGAQLVEHRTAVAANSRGQDVGLDRRRDERTLPTARRALRRTPRSRDARRGCCATRAGTGRTPAARPVRPRGAARRAIAAAADAARRRRSTHATRRRAGTRRARCDRRLRARRSHPMIRSFVEPNRRATSAITNGPWVRAYLPTSSSSGRRHRLGERHRQTDRQRAPQRVAVAGRVLAGGVADLAADGDLDRPLLGEQRVEPLPRRQVCVLDVGFAIERRRSIVVEV